MCTVIVAPVHLTVYLKFQIVLAFLFRLPSDAPYCPLHAQLLTKNRLVGLAILRLHYVREYTHSANAGLALEPILLVQQAYLCWGIISATIPNLKAFVDRSAVALALDLIWNDIQTHTARKDRMANSMSLVR